MRFYGARGSQPKLRNPSTSLLTLDGHHVVLYSMRITQEIRTMAIARMRQIDASIARWYHCTA